MKKLILGLFLLLSLKGHTMECTELFYIEPPGTSGIPQETREKEVIFLEDDLIVMSPEPSGSSEGNPSQKRKREETPEENLNMLRKCFEIINATENLKHLPYLLKDGDEEEEDEDTYQARIKKVEKDGELIQKYDWGFGKYTVESIHEYALRRAPLGVKKFEDLPAYTRIGYENAISEAIKEYKAKIEDYRKEKKFLNTI